MVHDDDHDPVLMHDRCYVCFFALQTTWVYLAPELQDVDPREAVRLIRRHLLVGV